MQTETARPHGFRQISRQRPANGRKYLWTQSRKEFKTPAAHSLLSSLCLLRLPPGLPLFPVSPPQFSPLTTEFHLNLSAPAVGHYDGDSGIVQQRPLTALDCSMAPLFRAAGVLALVALCSGCFPMAPYGYQPGTGPVGYPGSTPWPPGQPLTGPVIPVIPVTGNVPVTQPAGPSVPVIPGNPTIPLTQPDPGPTAPDHPANSPPAGFHDFWVPWPLPPRSQLRGQQISGLPEPEFRDATDGNARPMRATVAGGSPSADQMHDTAGLPGKMPSFGERVPGVQATPAEDLRFRGGHTIPDLKFVNLYVGGDDCWSKSDIRQIDSAIAAAMSDRNLNNVMMQYFNNRPITSVALPSHPLTGYRPPTMTQGDVERCVEYLYRRGFLQGYDLSSTVFNFLLPRGTVLTDDTGLSATAMTPPAVQHGKLTLTAASRSADEEQKESPVPHAEESSSLMGLGGYHGSLRIDGRPVYYTADVFSERLENGRFNGIPVFSDPWKNVVATLYHELNEARTDPDVQDAIRHAGDPAAERYLGWTSDRGEECGDYPIDESRDLSTIVREVTLTDGSGTVPVQFQYSNAVHGPEGPIPEPHPLR